MTTLCVHFNYIRQDAGGPGGGGVDFISGLPGCMCWRLKNIPILMDFLRTKIYPL